VTGIAPRNILFATTVLPGAMSTGGEIVSQRIVEALSQIGANVKVLGYARSGYKRLPRERLIQTRQIETRLSPLSFLGWVLQAGFRGRAISIQKYCSHSYLKVLDEELKGSYDVVIIDHAQTGWLLPRLKDHLVLHVCHNNEAELYRERAGRTSGIQHKILQRESELISSLERQLANSCKAIWTLTETDARYFRELGARNVNVLSVPGVRASPTSRLTDPVTDVALLGTWTWKPNRIGLDWFVNQVVGRFPPDVRIRVAGSGADDLKGRFPNVEIMGRVPSAAEFLGQAKCIAIPSKEGAGLQVKTLDALAVGRPVVATSLACRGIVVPEVGVTIADEPDDFAKAMVDCVRQSPQVLDNNWTMRREATFLSELERSMDSLYSHGSGG